MIQDGRRRWPSDSTPGLNLAPGPRKTLGGSRFVDDFRQPVSLGELESKREESEGEGEEEENEKENGEEEEEEGQS